eukprot:scaffold157447_cov14-Prasinocladus_malaysianus.AAC.1
MQAHEDEQLEKLRLLKKSEKKTGRYTELGYHHLSSPLRLVMAAPQLSRSGHVAMRRMHIYLASDCLGEVGPHGGDRHSSDHRDQIREAAMELDGHEQIQRLEHKRWALFNINGELPIVWNSSLGNWCCFERGEYGLKVPALGSLGRANAI